MELYLSFSAIRSGVTWYTCVCVCVYARERMERRGKIGEQWRLKRLWWEAVKNSALDVEQWAPSARDFSFSSRPNVSKFWKLIEINRIYSIALPNISVQVEINFRRILSFIWQLVFNSSFIRRKKNVYIYKN